MPPERSANDERGRIEQILAELERERNLSDSFINSAPGVCYMFDSSGRFLRWNRNFERVSGYSHEEFARLHPLDLFRGADRDLIAERIGETFVTGKSDAEAVMVTKDGRSLDYFFTGCRVVVDGEPCLIGMGIDVGSRKQFEAHMRQVQRAEGVGQLAAGVAHDFNNILTVIQGQAGRLLAYPQIPAPCRESLEQIALAADRAARLTSQLLVMTRQQVMQMRPLDVNDVLMQMSSLLERLVGEAISLDIRTARELPAVLADLGMVEQVLMNLVINARDVTPEGGRIAVATELVEIDADYVASHPGTHTGRFVCLSVTDHGPGIPPENLSRIFEPFFTTKEVGKGTGLGLPTVESILKQHHGFVDLSTQVGEGTQFRLYFPVSRAPAERLVASEAAEPARDASEKTILVVEDEATVAMMIEGVLHDHGFRTLTAADGHEALSIWAKHRDEIDMLVTDLVMPRGISGRELTHRIWRDAPDLPVIFVSGYTAESIRADLAEHSRLRYLQKPYRPQALVALVRKTLQSLT